MVQLRTVRPTRAGVAPFVTATARETFELDRLEVDSPRCLLGVVETLSTRVRWDYVSHVSV